MIVALKRTRNIFCGQILGRSRTEVTKEVKNHPAGNKGDGKREEKKEEGGKKKKRKCGVKGSVGKEDCM